MLYKLCVFIIVCTVLLGHGISSPVSAAVPRTQASAHAYHIMQRGNPNNTVRLIVSLNRTPSARQHISPFGMQLHKQSVRSAQIGFVGRQNSRFVANKHQPTLAPIVMGTMRRQDVALLAQDPEVVAIEEDECLSW